MEESQLCSYYVLKKRRFCKVPPLHGRKFCPHHSHLDTETDLGEKTRVPCPFDPKHYCYLSKLEKHKRKCNAREKEKPHYYKQNINAFDEDMNFETQKVTIDDISNEDLMKLIKKIEIVYSECIPVLRQNQVINSFVMSELNNFKSICSEKHLKQQASLLGLLEEQNLLNNSSCIIEFGAGKGQLMFWIVKTISNCTNKTFVLVDRETRRYKMDNKFKEDPNVTIKRLRIDIQHLYLGGVNAVGVNLKRTVGVSKHLCGSATDLALKCLMETITDENNGGGNAKLLRPSGIVMSTCCHHRCKWNVYVGREFILKQGFTEAEFRTMCIISSWATCGLKKRDKIQDSDIHNIENDPTYTSEVVNRYVTLNLPHSKREEIGKMCKHLIDMGRAMYLNHFDMHSELVYYVDSSVSLENIALVSICK